MRARTEGGYGPVRNIPSSWFDSRMSTSASVHSVRTSSLTWPTSVHTTVVAPVRVDVSRTPIGLAADGVVVAAPSYLHGTHHSIQRFLDRGLQFWKHFDRLAGKPAVALAKAGIRDGEGFALLGVENLVRAMGMALKGRAVVHAALPGEAFLTDEGPAAAALLADALFAPVAQAPSGPCCAQCGGTYFELRGGSRVYCLSCGGVGTASADAGGIRVDVAPPAHPWLGPAARKAHGEWLIGMKEKFLRERERLKAVAARHKGGDFI